MARIKKTSPLLNLTNFQTFIVDDNPLSQYFRISELSDLLTAGKNGFLLEGSTFLKPSTEIKIEILDTEGNPIYVEPGEGIPEYYEGLSKLISVHIYEDTPIGIGKITILGELDSYLDENGFVQPIPEDWSGIYNIKWEREIKINKNIPNETRVRFNKRPSVIIEEVDEILYSRDVINGAQTNGSVRGVAITPSEGTYYPTYRGGVRYLIENTSDDFKDGGQKISISGTTIQDADIIEYINQRSLVVQTPYVDSNGYVANLTGSSYSLTYQHTDNPVASSILGSFGRFEINNLATFVGDVERIKVFRKSRSSNLDYQVIQDTRIDSSELITAIISGSSERVGYFSSSYAGGTSWDAYWNTNGGTATLDSSKIYKGIKLQNSTLSTDLGNDIRLESGSEYTLEFYNYYDTSSNNTNDYLRVYLTSTLQSGSGIANYYLTQSLTTLTGSNQYRSANKIIYNFTPPITDNWTVNFKSVNESSYWHVGSVSLKASHELGFSPDEFTFSIPIDRSLERETFDFKFEFFDINNNYVPLTTTAAQTFQSGNINVIDKDIVVDLDKQFFNFSSSLEGVPSEQQINISITKNRILGNLLITSQAFDTGGFEIPTGSNSFNPYYAAGVPYPGVLSSSYFEDVYSADGHVKLESFTGSLHNHPTQSGDVIVDRITYTLTETESSQPFVKRFTISRLVAGASGVDGTDSKGLFVSSNTNQLIFEPTGPSLKPTGQTILIQAKRSNLESLITPITANSSSGTPALSVIGTTDGVTTYSLNGALYSYTLGERTYAFTGSDSLGVEYSDFVKITPVMNFDGVSVVLSNESATFTATSTGTVTSADLDGGDGKVFVRIGSNEIEHNDGLTTGNRFDIVQITASGCTANEISPTTNSYGISAMSSDSASLDMLIRYKAGDASTTVDFRKIVSYTKAKKAAPVLEISSTPNAQSVSAKSTGVQIDSFSNVSVVVKEAYNGATTNKTIAGLTATSTDIASISTNAGAGTITLAGKTLTDATNSTTVNVSAVVTDSEGTSRTLTDTITLAKVKKAAPSVILTATPQTQTVAATSQSIQTGTLQQVLLDALEGSTSVFNSASILASNFSGASVTTKTLTLGTIANGVPAASASIGINYTDTEGTTTSKTINVSAVKSIAGATGASGSAGNAGATGLRTATGMVHYQITSSTAPSSPTATSYNFSTGVFTGLTSNWGTGAPTYASGNSNKYWYAIYTVVESTPDSGTGTPSFGTPTQAIGFSGLVSFTAANNVSDGANTLSFGVAGATLINGSNISTGKIISTNYSAGTPYTTAGSILDLDNGRFATKTFYVDASGNAGFKGTLEAAAGSFTGTLVAAGGTFSGDVTAAGGKIGGWTIDSSSIYVPNAISLNSSAKTIVIADTSGVPRVNFNTNTSFSDRSTGSPTTVTGTSAGNSGTYNPGNFDRTLGTMTSVNNRTYNVTTTFTQANATTALTITNNAVPNTIDVWSQIILNNGVTSTVVAEYKDGVTFGSSVQWAAINGKVVSVTLTGNGNEWTISQRFKWTYQGSTYFSANYYNQPAVSVTLAGANSFVEIIAGGIQVSRDASNYVVMDRAGSAAMLQVGGEGTFTGDVTANTSDKRLKNNIRLIDNPLEKLEKINGVYFNWNDVAKQLANKSDNEEVGFLAQEVQSVLPQIIKPAPFDIDITTGESKSGEHYLTIQYEKIVPLLVEAIKELKKEIEELKRNR
jgi:hypothetical protein